MTSRFATSLSALLAAMTLASAMAPGRAQNYTNVVNTRFRTVSSGPQSAMIVDVPDASNRSAVRTAVMSQYATLAKNRNAAVTYELAQLRRSRLIKPNQNPALVDAAIIRSGGRLQLAAPQRQTRGNNALTFTAATTGSGAWTPSDAAAITQLAATINTSLVQYYGSPSWSGNVTIRNLDPTLNTQNEVLGAVLVINGADIEIDLPTFSDTGTEFMALCQAMAQAFHGPARIAYDAWEIGMARAVTVVIAQQQNNASINPSSGFFFTPEYDILNEPQLGNNTFQPPSAATTAFSNTNLSGMLIPRLQMASTAWLKCYIENPGFFATFNADYYQAWAANQGVSNNVTTLRTIAGSALLPSTTVEMIPFQTWYEQQYVLDTSITVGPKLYAYVQPTFPSATEGGGAADFLVYYNTTPAGDEQPLNGTINDICWDYTYQNQLTLPSFQAVTTSGGFGSVSPVFQGLGSPGTMRVAMDFLVGNSYNRVLFPANETGSETAPNDFQGVTVGADTGNLTVQYGGAGSVIHTAVTQGAFGAAGSSGQVPPGFSKTIIQFTPASGSILTYQRNTAFNNSLGVQQTWVLIAPGPTNSLSYSVPSGPNMLSIPLQPLNHDLAVDFGQPPASALIAQYRQDQTNPDNYLRYPNLPLYQPGYAVWTDFPQAVTGTIIGVPTDVEANISVSLEYGWNQIGTPFSTGSLDVNSYLQFQYEGGNVLNLSDAVSQGLVAAGIIGFDPASGYYDVTTAIPTGVTATQNTLTTWRGYWIRCLETEGVTLTYLNPSPAKATMFTRSQKAALQRSQSTSRRTDGWRLPVNVVDAAGHTSAATLGQASRGSDSFVPSLDAANPPAFPAARAVVTARFAHPEWNGGSSDGTYLSDVRALNASSTWNLTVSTPTQGSPYTVTWGETALLPRGMRLTLTDKTSGASCVMNNSASYTFTPGKGETSRSLTISAAPGSLGRLRIANVVANAPLGRAGRALSALNISFEVSGSATTGVVIYNAGRAMRHLVTGRAVSAGPSQLVWDGKDDQGRTAAAGAYMLEITAADDQGNVTRSVTPLILGR